MFNAAFPVKRTMPTKEQIMKCALDNRRRTGARSALGSLNGLDMIDKNRVAIALQTARIEFQKNDTQALVFLGMENNIRNAETDKEIIEYIGHWCQYAVDIIQ